MKKPAFSTFARWCGLLAVLVFGLSWLFSNPNVTAATETSTPSATAPQCSVVSLGLNLRSGPGINYNPPLAVLVRDMHLTPVARNAAATWLQVNVDETGASGWVSAGRLYVRCNIDVRQLPVASAPGGAAPAPTAAAPAQGRNTPTPTPTIAAAADRRVTLLAPENHSTIEGRQTFRWQPNFSLPPNTAFEVVFWQEGQDPLTQSKGGVPPTEQTEVGITLEILDQVGIIRSGLNHWGVLLVQPETASQPYRRLAFLQGDFVFTYSPVPPTPTPTDTPTRTPRP